MNIHELAKHLVRYFHIHRQQGNTTALVQAAIQIGAPFIVLEHQQQIALTNTFGRVLHVRDSRWFNFMQTHQGPVVVDHHLFVTVIENLLNDLERTEAELAEVKARLELAMKAGT